MVSRAGWDLVEQVDVTQEYADTARRDLRAYESRAELAAEVLGASELAERLTWRHDYIQAIDDGLLRRELFVTIVRD